MITISEDKFAALYAIYIYSKKVMEAKNDVLLDHNKSELRSKIDEFSELDDIKL